MNRRAWIGSLLGSVVATGAGLAAWKYVSMRAADAASTNQPESGAIRLGCRFSRTLDAGRHVAQDA